MIDSADPLILAAADRARIIGLLDGMLEATDLLYAHRQDRDPGLKTRLASVFREVSRLASVAAERLEPRAAERVDDRFDRLMEEARARK